MSMTNSNNIQLESQEHFNLNEQTDPSLLSLTEWVQLKKETSYKLYLDLHQRLQKKEKYIENVLVTYQRQLQDKSLEQSTTEGEGTTNPESKSRKNQVFSEKVRDFDSIPLKQEQSNLVLGSSIIGKLESDATIPLDTAIHAYRGSTTKEKIKFLEKYECKKLKTLILQDGTNTVSKFHKSCDEILDDMFSLIEACKNEFQPDVFVVMEVIPFKETDYNRSKNKLIDEVNAALKERLASLGENFVLLKMNYLIRSIPSFNPKINHYNFLYHDNVHLNYNHGIPFLKNHLLMFLL